MTPHLRDAMMLKAGSVAPPALDPMAVVADGERLARRRRTRRLAAASLAVVLTLGTGTVLASQGEGTPKPSKEPTPTPGWDPGTRPLTYGEGQTLHLGDTQVDTGLDFLSLDLTDDGAALTTADGGVWFTDGSAPERVGTTLSGLRGGIHGGWGWALERPRDWVVSDNAGSLLAWLEYPDRRTDRPDLVVYDSDSRRILAREPVGVADGNTATLIAVVGTAVFLTEGDNGSSTAVATYRYDVASRALDRVPTAVADRARRDVARALVVGSPTQGPLLQTPEETTVGENTLTHLLVRGSVLDRLVLARTGRPVAISVPEVYEAQHLFLTQWLDDDRFAVLFNPGPHTGELLVCQITAGRCDVVIDSSEWTSAPLTPGDGMVGAEVAVGRVLDAEAQP